MGPSIRPNYVRKKGEGLKKLTLVDRGGSKIIKNG